ncbi:MAG: hypothetical protein DRG33_00480 [Deltaproteobacteria bacterium]|nr:MAG: hypothetical protein DRG33_00480 [Deltaproteobacteria bacterium]
MHKSMKISASIFLVVVIIGAMIFLSSGNSVTAAPITKELYSVNQQTSTGELECTPFDVLFLIDQSGSMSDPDGGVFSDPYAQRIEAVKWAISHIAFVNLNACQNDVLFRLGVVPFGGEIKKVVPFTNINPEDDIALDLLLNTLLPALESEDLGVTDFSLAFDKANEMFKELPLASGDKRQQAIIVITDGAACSPQMSETDNCGHSGHVQNYMNDLEKQIIHDFDVEGFYLYIVGINRYQDLPIPSQKFYQENARLPWEKITSNYLSGSEYRQLGVHHNDIPSAFVDIFENLSGVKGEDITCAPLAVEPYLEMVQLNIFRNTDLSPVEIKVRNFDEKETVFIQGVKQPGEEIEVTPKYFISGLNESYVFKNPVPGKWIVTMSDPSLCDELRGQFIAIAATSEKIAPLAGLPQNPDKDITGLDYDEDDPYYLKYRIVDKDGNALPDYGGQHKIKAVVDIKSPSGENFTRQLEKSSDPGVWQTDKPLPTSEMGVYSYSVVGTTRNLEGTDDIIVIEAQTGTYEVTQAIERFSWHIDNAASHTSTPTKSGFGCWTNPNDMVLDIIVTEYGAPDVPFDDLTPIDSSSIFASEETFSVDVSDSTGVLLNTTPMRYVGDATDLGHYQVSIPGTLLSEKGAYQIRINRIPEINTGWGERISPDINDLLKITRTEEYITSKESCTHFKIALALVLALLLAYFIYSITGKPRGFLHFMGPDGEQIQQPSVTGVWRKSVLGKSRLGPIGSYIEITKIIIKRDGSAAEHDSLDDGIPSIKLTIHAIENGNKVIPVEDEIVHDQEQVSLINGYSVIYTRRGVAN